MQAAGRPNPSAGRDYVLAMTAFARRQREIVNTAE
jgi:hypothetical protein